MSFNVIEFIPTLNDAGAETLVKDYCIISKKKKYANLIPVVIWKVNNSANMLQLKESEIKVYSIYNRQSLLTRTFNKIFGKYYVPYKLSKIAKAHNVNVIHIHLGILSYAKRLSEINKNIYFFYTCHNVVGHYFPNKTCKEYITVKYLLEKGRLQLIALHESMKHDLNALFNINSTIVVNNGIDFEKFALVKKTKENIRKEIGIPIDAFVVGHVGRFMVQKNHNFLIEVFKYISLLNDKAHLLLIGNGELELDIRRKIEEYALNNKVTILSHRTDINELMKAMDVFVFPSLFEGLGIVLIEAQVSGLKCVVSDKVPKEATITNLVHCKSLDECVENWAEEIIKKQTTYLKYENYNDFDICNVLHDLINKYINCSLN